MNKKRLLPMHAFGYLDLLIKAIVVPVLVISSYALLNLSIFGENIRNLIRAK